jgi:NAD(P)H-dependent flavin oxidoreductase YrpB (nitropropane dioxygenase family)
MSSHTPVCELLGIEHPIVEAPLAADPRLPAAVSNAGGLGSLGLSWADDAGDVVRETGQRTGKVKKEKPKAGSVLPSGGKVNVKLG